MENIHQEAWKYFPDTFAQTLSKGKWQSYKHIRFMQDIMLPGIIEGGGRYVVSMPPRHGKSEYISHWLPTWFLNTYPDRRVILTSYSADLAAKFGRKIRNNIVKYDLNVELMEDSKAKNKFDTPEDGGMITAGVSGTITGEGGHLIIIDDPLKNWAEAMSANTRDKMKDWFTSTLETRLEPGGTVILLMTRWHNDDLAGYLLGDEYEGDPFTEIWLPAIAEDEDPMGRKPGEALCPSRYSTEVLESRRKSSKKVFQALYQGRPQGKEGELWKRSYWNYWNMKSLPDQFDEIIQSWDLNFKEKSKQTKKGDDGAETDPVAGFVLGRKKISKFETHYYVLDRAWGRWGFRETKRRFRVLSERWPEAYKKLVENKANGPALEDDLKGDIPGIKLIEPQGDKYTRAEVVEPEIHDGKVFLPDPEMAGYDWVNKFIDEAAAFPNGKNDDQVDAVSQGLNFLIGRTRHSIYKLVGAKR